MKTEKVLIWLIVLGILLRIGFGIYYYQDNKPPGWEYTAIANNIIAGHGFSLFKTGNNRLDIDNTNPELPKTSAYMMPGYVFLITPFLTVSNNYYLLIFVLHALLAGLTAYLMFLYISNKFNQTAALLAVLIFCLLPEFIYSSNTIGPTSVFHLLVILFIYIESRSGNETIKNCILSFAAVLMIYFRPESALFIMMYLIYSVFQKNIKRSAIMATVIVLFLSPWMIRNYIQFDKFIPLTTSSGLNLYRGHNPYYDGFWMDEKIRTQIFRYKDNIKFESIMNHIYLDEAIRNIRSNPTKEITKSLDKIIRLWLIDFNDERSISLFYTIPWIILLILFLFGTFKFHNRMSPATLCIYMIAATLTAAVFFVLPRYQTMMKIAVIPYAANSIYYILQRISKREVR